jgi:protein required for attachment to host cells
MKTWIVAANAGGAKFFSQAGLREVPQEIAELQHPEGRAHEIDLETDVLGERSPARKRDGTGMPRVESTYQPYQTPRQHENERFARQVAAYLKKAHDEGRFTQLVLMASPEFLALLRKVLDHHVVAAVRVELHKDYTKLKPTELREQVEAHWLPER